MPFGWLMMLPWKGLLGLFAMSLNMNVTTFSLGMPPFSVTSRYAWQMSDWWR